MINKYLQNVTIPENLKEIRPETSKKLSIEVSVLKKNNNGE